jgi:hypothetical protein
MTVILIFRLDASRSGNCRTLKGPGIMNLTASLRPDSV